MAAPRQAWHAAGSAVIWVEAPGMIEPIMFFGIGFLAASLFGLVLIPLVHNRAVRLTMRRLEAATPLSMAEIQADKDQLRAEFAMSTRRLELSVEQMKSKTTNQLAELGKKTDAINRLKVELGEKTAAIFALEAREKALREQLQTTEREFSVKIGSLREAERTLSDKEAELAKLSADLDERSVHADSQRIELVALRTQVDALKNRIGDYEKEAREIGDRLDRERKEAASATNELSEERGRVDLLGDRVGQLERALIAQTTEAEILGRRVQELEARLAEQMRVLAEREFECGQLRDQLTTVQKAETDLRAEIASGEARHKFATENLKTEKSQIADQLAKAKADHTAALNEIAAMKREAEQTWAAERVENALLRERINDIAAEIARLTVALEGQDSPIEAMLAGSFETNGSGHAAETPVEGKGNLADRIRALQIKASRVQPAN
jgi:chromosome segregation ATPase